LPDYGFGFQLRVVRATLIPKPVKRWQTPT
jgi:hypothetical protein